jgi:carbohydrate diacid regulator
MKDATPRNVGVVDNTGMVMASVDLSAIGAQYLPPSQDTADMCVIDGRTYKPLENGGTGYDYAVFVQGDDDLARTLCVMASVAAREAQRRFEDSNDRSIFVKSILSGNILPGDIHARAQELQFGVEMPRACMLIRQLSAPDFMLTSILREIFPDKQKEFIMSMNAADIVVVTDIPGGADNYITDIAATLITRLEEELGMKCVIGLGTTAKSLRELADKYKEAQVAIDVGRVFETEKAIICYETLGLGRLIYQLPTRLCEMFLSEVFKKNPISALDSETMTTINQFFENSLNVSETSRKLFVHRNTLVYRLEKIKKIVGLDLREFDHAVVFKVATMVRKYLDSQTYRRF